MACFLICLLTYLVIDCGCTSHICKCLSLTEMCWSGVVLDINKVDSVYSSVVLNFYHLVFSADYRFYFVFIVAQFY